MAGMNVRDDILSKIEKPKPSGKDLAYRAVAAVLGGPVDLTAMVMKPFGYGVEKPVLGSEWIGQQMQDVGLVSEARDPLQEFMASLLVPGGGIEAVPALAGKGMAMLPAALGVVKGKGGNWLTGSVEDALRPLKKAEVPNAVEAAARAAPAAQQSLNQWIEGPLTKYVKTRMASPDDEIRKLADQGVLHFTPDEPGSFNSLLYGRRQELGQKPMGEATSDLGMSWEGLVDMAVRPQTALDLSSEERALTFGGKSDIDPNTQVYSLGSTGPLDFRHLTDELSNALNPESGLPRALQLTPDQMKNLSVEKAVRRVADINKWRANQMAEANKAIAFDEKTAPVFKEYQTVPGHGNGQPNEKGLHWREIKQPEALPLDRLPTGWKVVAKSGADDRVFYEAVGPGRGSSSGYRGRTAEEAKASALRELANEGSYKRLENQLKYEGDTMGHCVGGYCDAVLSGESKVYTLRDKAGKPHVTIEVAPPGEGVYTRDQYKTAWEEAGLNPREFSSWYQGSSAFPDAAAKILAQSVGSRIKQIKGAKNSAPKDEYVPFIQDFIRSGNFSDVGDLENAQLKKASQAFNETELKTLEKHGAKLTGEEYLTYAEVEALQSLFKSK